MRPDPTSTTAGCCGPVSDAPLSPELAERLAARHKALADPVRLRLLSLIASAATGEVCACDLNEPLARSQATVSHHLSVLQAAGLIHRTQRGKWAWFRIAPDQQAYVAEVLASGA